ncbi:uncharacterized protein [Mytilus edulis]|uniref:uncharacterized protein n=1 Tax=Mytilus edulis TaxID=6550 RepID=UPI0039F0FB4A
MASPSKDFCSLCKEDDVTSDAVLWCTECEVFLCVECEKHHKRSRSSKDHYTISAQNYLGLPSFIKGTTNLCTVHDRKFELYCSFHASACCVLCVTDEHQTCQTLNPLSDILKEVKSSAAVTILKKDLKDLNENFDEIQCSRILEKYDKSKRNRENTSQEGKYIEDLKRGHDLNERYLHVTISPVLAAILNDVMSFGEITADTRPCNGLANAGRKNQAQQLVPFPTIDQIKPSFSNTLNVPEGKGKRFVDCCILPDGNCVVLDEVCKSLIMFRNDGTFIRSIVSFKDFPDSVSFVNDDTVAVSFYYACDVTFVDMGRGKVDRNFKFPKHCSGVSSDGQVLVISMPTVRNVIVMNLIDESEQNLEEIYIHNMSLLKGNIYGTNSSHNTISCYNLSGEMLWNVKHKYIAEPC